MADTQPRKPTSLPRDATPSPPGTQRMPPVQPEDTQPIQPAAPVVGIPLPPGRTPARVVHRKRRRRNAHGWLSTALLLLLFSLVLLMTGVIFLLIFAPEYTDPYIPGRVATQTAVAERAAATNVMIATREGLLLAAQTQAADDAAATTTAVVLAQQQQGTQAGLNAQGTAFALAQTATSGAVAFNVTGTALVEQAQQTATRTVGDATSTAATAQAQLQQTPRAVFSFATPFGSEPTPRPLPTAQIAVLFSDTFDTGLRPEWTVAGNWRVISGRASADICGTSITIGATEWNRFSVAVDTYNPSAQFALIFGYSSGRLFINFNAEGSVWWLVNGAEAVADETLTTAYDATLPQRIRVNVFESRAQVYVGDVLLKERVLPASITGPIGIYTCPSPVGIPVFDNFQVISLP